MSLSAIAETPPEVTLTRLEGGTPQAPTDVNARFSDTYSYAGLKLQFVYPSGTSVSDTTTWTATLAGNPVRLVK